VGSDFSSDGLTATVIMGSIGGATSPGTAYTSLVGVDLALAAGADVEGTPVAPGAMLYLGTGRRTLRLRSADAGFAEP
jgi:redox-sensitive bicupin YhaK (pirin superfamily)